MATLLGKPFDSEIAEKIKYLMEIFRDEQSALDPAADFDIYIGATLPTMLAGSKPSINIYDDSDSPEKPTSITYAQYRTRFNIDCVVVGAEGSTAPGYDAGHSDENAYNKLSYLKFQVYTVLTALVNHKFGFGNQVGGKNYPSWEFFQIENKENAAVVIAGRWTLDVQYGIENKDNEHVQALEEIFVDADNYSAKIVYP